MGHDAPLRGDRTEAQAALPQHRLVAGYEGVGQGTLDRVLSSTAFTLASDDNIEYLATTNEVSATAMNLVGNGLAQTIVGNAGVNILVGNGGADILRGLGGTYRFAFRALGDSGPTALSRDTIADFDDADGRRVIR